MADKLLIAWDPVYAHPLPEGHRFPMLKYELIPEQLIYEGTISTDHLIGPRPCADHIILLTHTAEYLDRIKNLQLSAREQRRIGFPQSPELTQRELIITQGTIDCCTYAFINGVSLNVAGGTHHAFADHGEGFCLLNDFAVASNYLLSTGKVSTILIIDLDVHQGNGTASIFHNNFSVFTFSMHGKNNYPFKKEISDRDIELPDKINDEQYLQVLKNNLPELIKNVQPDFAFFLSGVDILNTDRFGKLDITINGCYQRDEYVLTLLKQEAIPVVIAMGGGYSPQIKTIVEAHCNTFRLAKRIFGLN